MPYEIPRPPVLFVPDSGPIRHDINSRDMTRVHPEVEKLKTSHERREHLLKCDMMAYDNIHQTFPDFTPPCIPRGTVVRKWKTTNFYRCDLAFRSLSQSLKFSGDFFWYLYTVSNVSSFIILAGGLIITFVLHGFIEMGWE